MIGMKKGERRKALLYIRDRTIIVGEKFDDGKVIKVSRVKEALY